MDEDTKAEIEFIKKYPRLANLITLMREHQYAPPTDVTTFPPVEDQE